MMPWCENPFGREELRALDLLETQTVPSCGMNRTFALSQPRAARFGIHDGSALWIDLHSI